MENRKVVARLAPTSHSGAGRKYDMRRLSYAGTFTNPLKVFSIRAMEWVTAKVKLLSMIRTTFLGLDLQSQLRVPVGAAANGGGLLSGFAPPVARPVERQRELTNEYADFMTSRIGSGASPTWSGASGSTWGGSPNLPESSTVAGSDSVGPEARTASSTGDDAEGQGADAQESPSEQSQGTHVPRSEEQVATSGFAPSFRAMQIHDCYLVVETPEGITVIDQHALHERIMYEHLRERVLAGAVESQRLLVPQPVEVTAKEAALLLEQTESLNKVGLGVEDFGNGTLLVSRYPAMLKRVDLQELVRALIETLDGAGINGVQTSPRRDVLDELLHMMSCKAAVKAGQRLSQEEIDSLLVQRHLIHDAHHCPHGRPTALSLSRMELDRQFGRLG